MDTPRSESPTYPTSPPAAELDDHRFQPQSLPRSNTVSSRYRPEISQILDGEDRRHSSDDECAVYDEACMLSPGYRRGSFLHTKDSTTRSIVPEDRRSIRSERSVRFPSVLGSVSPSRSPSPPNSVDAFADPTRRMRDRAGTMTSHVPSEIGLTLNRTNSCRPTYTDGDDRLRTSEDNVNNPEHDVCFPHPTERSSRGSFIDFEEMDEFVQIQRQLRPGIRQRKMSTGEPARGRSAGFNPHRTGLKSNVIDSDTSLDEKDPQPEPGSPPLRPNRYSFFSSDMEGTVHAPEIGDLLRDNESFADMFRTDHGVWWLNCLDPSADELNMLMKAFSIHPLTSEDIRVQETREKVELFKNYYFVCFRSFIQDKTSEDYMDPINVYIIVFREGVLSFHFHPCEHPNNVRMRIRQLREYVALSADWICYALIDDIVDSFAPLIFDVERDSDAIEDAVFTARGDDYSALLKRIGAARKTTMGGMRLLGGKADVIKGFAKRCNEQWHITPRAEIGLYLGDIQDHILTMMGNLSHFEKMLSRSHANYLAQLSVDSIQANNRANEVLGKITTIATILVPLNLICGLFGMNVPVPGMESGTLAWFFGILGVILVFCCVSFLAAKRMKFI